MDRYHPSQGRPSASRGVGDLPRYILIQITWGAIYWFGYESIPGIQSACMSVGHKPRWIHIQINWLHIPHLIYPPRQLIKCDFMIKLQTSEVCLCYLCSDYYLLLMWSSRNFTLARLIKRNWASFTRDSADWEDAVGHQTMHLDIDIFIPDINSHLTASVLQY